MIIRGNALNLPLADSSVDLIVTSPPYFGLRSYQDTPQLCDRCRELLGVGSAYSYPATGHPDYDRNLREALPLRAPRGSEDQEGAQLMTTRDEVVEQAVAAMLRVKWPDGGRDGLPTKITAKMLAPAVLDAILPQITTVEELEALPPLTVLISAGGTVITRQSGPLDPEKLAIRAAVALLPLTVVWRP
jgi:hypothetical protein